MARTKDNTAKRRAEDRAKRRADAQARESSAMPDGDGPRSDDHDMTEALRGAASAAIAGAAVGAARAFAQRRGTDPEPKGEQRSEPADDSEPEREEQPEPADDHTPEEEREPEQGHQPAERERPLQAPLSGGQAREIMQRAREELQELRGAEAEAVSSVTRTVDGWRVGLEIVELRRIPESTDVLATYEVELDPDGRLVTFERTHRYVRSEADRE